MTTLNHSKKILMDGRWTGTHGIGRLSAELMARLEHVDILHHGPKPLSAHNLLWQVNALKKHQKSHDLYFSPGFQPVLKASMPYIMTICDLIYLHTPGIKGSAKKWFFEYLVKPSLHRAHKIVTISEYSKQSIASWANLPPEKIINVGCGISQSFTSTGPLFTPSFPYLLHVGNNKPHKNTLRLIEAFARAAIDPTIKLVLTCQATTEINRCIHENKLENRIYFTGHLSETELAAYYRGALSVILPSLYEGFGLPIIEAMACGTPVVTSNTTSCPEVAGNAAILLNPYDTTSIQHAIEQVTGDSILRNTMIKKGETRAAEFSWDKTARLVQNLLQ